MTRIEELKQLIAAEKDEVKVEELKKELIAEETKAKEIEDKAKEEMRKAEEARQAELNKVIEAEKEKIKAELKAEMEAEKAEAIRKAKEENDAKVKELTDKYVSEEAKKQIQAEEEKREAQRIKDEKAAAEEKTRREWEEERATILAKGRRADITEVAEEFKIPSHLKKYISGNTIEDMRKSAQAIVDDMLKQENDFEARVQAEVEKKFADGGQNFNKGNGGAGEGITLEKFKEMSIHEKYDLREKDYNLFSELKSKLDTERMS